MRYIVTAGQSWSGFYRVLLLTLTLALAAGCGQEVRYEALPSGATVLAFGDSVTYGTGASSGEDYPSVLAEKTGWRVINAGIPGDTARAARSRLAPLLAEHQPDLVIVELGGNDFLRRHSTDSVEAALRDIVQQSKASGAITVLVSVPRFSVLRATAGALSDSPIYATLAEEEGVLLAPDIFAEVLSDEDLRADPIHPNAAGYRQFTDELLALLQAAGLWL